MEENEIRDLAQRGVETMFDEDVDTERADALSTVLATWCFETIAKETENSPEDSEELQVTAVQNAIQAAYLAGLLDAETNQPGPLTTVSKDGNTYNFYFS